MRQLLSQDDSDGPGVAGINRDRERPGISIVAINRAVRFPQAIGVTSWMIVVADEEDFRPKILLQTVLRLDRSQVITCRHDAAVENDQIVISGCQYKGLLGAGAEGEAGEKNGEVIGDFGKHG